MPSTIREVFAGAGLEPEGCVPWNQLVPCRDTGVYAVALTDNPESLVEAQPAAPLRRAAFTELLGVREQLRLDGQRPSAAVLERRLTAFWLPDEVVLYIGLSSRQLAARVREYYRTPLGAAKPHAGGWWLKTLSVLNDLWVHYAPTPNYDDAEHEMLRTFAGAVSSSSREALHDPVRVMPFANLKDADDLIKDHGIKRATGPMPAANASAWRDRESPSRSDHATAATRPSAPAPPASTNVSPHYRTLPVTASDRGAGRVRIGRGATKQLFPSEPGKVDVELRGHRKTCSWNPRFGPPERLGGSQRGQAPPRQTRPRRRGTARHTRERHPMPELSRAVGSTRSPAPSAGQAWRRCHSTVVLQVLDHLRRLSVVAAIKLDGRASESTAVIACQPANA